MSWGERLATWGASAAILAAVILFFKAKIDAERQADFDRMVASLCDNPACDCALPCECDNCECGLVPLDPPAPVPVPDPQKQEPAKLATRVWLHTINGCPPCVTEKGKSWMWLQQNWEFAIFDDSPGEPGKLYPWYEVRDSEGFEFSVIGQHTPESILRERNRAKNAASANRR